jgi:hypothetical protein
MCVRASPQLLHHVVQGEVGGTSHPQEIAPSPPPTHQSDAAGAWARTHQCGQVTRSQATAVYPHPSSKRHTRNTTEAEAGEGENQRGRATAGLFAQHSKPTDQSKPPHASPTLFAAPRHTPIPPPPGPQTKKATKNKSKPKKQNKKNSAAGSHKLPWAPIALHRLGLAPLSSSCSYSS